MKRALSITATILVLALFVRFAVTFHWRAVGAVLAQAAPAWVAIAILANIGSLAAKAHGWKLLMGKEGPPKSIVAHHATFIGAATGSFAISIGGEAARVRWIVMRSPVRAATALRGLVRSRVTEILMFSALIVGGSAMLPHSVLWRFIELAALVVIGSCIVLWRIGRRATQPTRDNAPNRAFGRALSEARETLRSPNVAHALFFAAVNWVCQWTSFAACAFAVTAHAPVAYALAALVLVNIGGAARITPGNVGVLTAAYVMVARTYAVAPASAVAASIVLQAVQILPIAVIGAIIFAIDQRRTIAIVGEPYSSV